ncbi:hypothetical protein CEXT_720011 [Caerostris extrusa]|uniref:Uncharacterized protein n=1 Tax=Caerostris extrusa TaxID=172846 RepID=A0AAV4TAT9_CAEEX|nr:hypothetical protein CEXT_720011 [Caerostris extrusa]
MQSPLTKIGVSNITELGKIGLHNGCQVEGNKSLVYGILGEGENWMVKHSLLRWKRIRRNGLRTDIQDRMAVMSRQEPKKWEEYD